MILYKATLRLGIHDCDINIYLVDKVINGLQDLSLPWEDGDINIDGICLTYKGKMYILVENGSVERRQTLLHECLHAVNQIWNSYEATLDLGNDEIYVREVSYLQEFALKIIDSYDNDQAIKNENNSN